MTSQKTFLHFNILDTTYRCSMMKNIHSPNLFMGPDIWPHEYLISPIEISVNWPGSKQLWTRPIYTNFNGAMRSYLEPPWTMSNLVCEGFSSCSTEIWLWKCWVKCKKKKNDDVTLQYSIHRSVQYGTTVDRPAAIGYKRSTFCNNFFSFSIFFQILPSIGLFYFFFFVLFFFFFLGLCTPFKNPGHWSDCKIQTKQSTSPSFWL